MRNPTDYPEKVRWQIVRLYLSDDKWSHRKLQKEVLNQPAPTRGGGHIAREILRYQGISDDSLKGVLARVETDQELYQKLIKSNAPEITVQMVMGWFSEQPKFPRGFLLIWNPERWAWETLQQELREFKMNGVLLRRWGCGNTQSIKPGDRIFFIKLGTKFPRGIMASGYAENAPVLDAHWSGEKGRQGWSIEVRFDVILDPSSDVECFINDSLLTSDIILKNQAWAIKSSGIRIRPEVLSRLEQLWFKTFKAMIKSILALHQSGTGYNEGRVIERLSRVYERDPRAREACLHYLGHSCLACGFNFEKTYGALGRKFIHVHHVIPISTRDQEYTPDPLKDLIPLCPNCHSMIHRIDVEDALAELKRILRYNENR